MKMKYVISGVVMILIVAAVTWMLLRKEASVEYRTAKVERGTLVQTVRATGVIQPVKLVQVGTQVNGPVRKLYVDFNDRVKEGDLVAQIDPTVYEAQLARDEANLKQSLASVEQTQAKLVQVSNELVRATELARRDMISKTELDAAVADRDSLNAQLKVVEAAVEQSRAALRLSKANLGYTTIRSPVDGVVIARNVDEGQTVVASMSAQVLFQIAADLHQVQVVASIPEADIGRIRIGQPVTFTVDAYDQDFTGTVSQVRMSAATVQNVVTYPVVVRAGNPDNKLFPSMTANIACEVARIQDTLKLPNAALRFKPTVTAVTPTTGTPAKERGRSRDGAAKSGPKVWIQEKPGQPPQPARLTPGITDGSFTEIKESEKLTEGRAVIIGLADPGAPAAAATVNPFTPQMPGKGQSRR